MAECDNTEEYPDEKYPDLALFLEEAFLESDFDGIEDRETALRFVEPPATLQDVQHQGREFLARQDAPWDWVEELANRNLGTPQEAQQWLTTVLKALEEGTKHTA